MPEPDVGGTGSGVDDGVGTSVVAGAVGAGVGAVGVPGMPGSCVGYCVG